MYALYHQEYNVELHPPPHLQGNTYLLQAMGHKILYLHIKSTSTRIKIMLYKIEQYLLI